jgi:3-hydroxyisobutyrate dehydrogenase-like beta-hydroxyacid dehydrogenase
MKAEKFKNRDFEAVGFPMTLMLKDCTLMVEQFRKKGIDVSPIEGVQKVLKKGVDNGHGESDGHSIYNTIHPEKN